MSDIQDFRGLRDGAHAWPPRHDIFGIRVSATDYESAMVPILRAARERRGAIVDHMSVHGLVEFSEQAALRSRINAFDIVAPDGQPVRWALNRLHGTRLTDRVYGPELMDRLCARAADAGVSIYLYGSLPDVLEKLRTRLLERHPNLRIAGYESPPFRPLTAEEDRAVIDRINRSGAGLIFLGLGCPKQEQFAYEHRTQIRGVQLCVGAAFDFLAGTKQMAPAWMQSRGLEWLFRLLTEPRRLWRRYLLVDTRFLMKFGRELARRAGTRSVDPTSGPVAEKEVL